MSLTNDANRAAELGMSYGEYMDKKKRGEIDVPKELSQETKDRIIEQWKNTDLNYSAIASEVGASFNGVKNTILKAGLLNYRHERKKNEPTTAATVEGSAENSHTSENVSESIVTDILENVKTLHRLEFINGSEEQAVIESITDRIEFYDKKIAELSGAIKIYERKRASLCNILKRNGYGDVLTLMKEEK